jgi:type VI secretion system secreted protein VgrG
MQGAAGQSRIGLQVGGRSLQVVAVEATERFNSPFSFQLEVLLLQGEHLSSLLADVAHIELVAPDGFSRSVTGLVLGVETVQPVDDTHQLCRIEVGSRLSLLCLQTDCRLIIGQSVPQMLHHTLCRHGIAESALQFHLTAPYAARPATLQAQENDLDFLLRLMTRRGMFLWSEIEDGNELIHIADHNQDCQPLERTELRYFPQAGMETTGGQTIKVGILTLNLKAELKAEQFIVHDADELSPDETLLAQRELPQSRQGEKQSCDVAFGPDVHSVEDAEHGALLRAQHSAASAYQVVLTSHAADLQVGRVIRLEADSYGSGISGDYLICAIDHRARQAAGLGLGGDDDQPYTNTVTLIPREVPWKDHWHGCRALPMTFNARIESDGLEPCLDDNGRYRYHQVADSATKAPCQNSADVRRLQPYVSAGRELPAGWHLPLHDQTEVLVSCLNNDPDRPMIVGSVANPDTPSVVTSDAPWLNRVVTAGQNELCFSDQRDAGAITLRTLAGHNILHLDAALAEHRIRLASAKGLVDIYAKKTLRIQSDDTLTENIGNDRIHTIENRHSTTTNSGKIHHQSATDTFLRAGKNISLHSGENIETQSGEDTTLTIHRSSTINVEGHSAAIHINSGTLTVQADQAIRIKGDGGGPITIGQNGGGLEMAANGDVTLFGNAITFKTSGGISLNGQVNIDATSPPAATLPEAVEAMAVTGIKMLTGELSKTQDEVSATALTIKLVDLFGGDAQTKDKVMPLYEGARCVISSDSGETYETTVTNAIIEVPDFVMRQRFQLWIDGLNVISSDREQTDHA